MLRWNEIDNFSDRHFSTILPAILTLFGLILSYIQYTNQEKRLNYDRAIEYADRNEGNIAELLDFFSKLPPSENENMVWINFSTDNERKQFLQDNYSYIYNLYGQPLVALEFSDLEFKNPSEFSKSEPKRLGLEGHIEYFRSKSFDIVLSYSFAHSLSMLDYAANCLKKDMCDKSLMCGFLSPLDSQIIKERYSEEVIQWRSTEPHEGQIALLSSLRRALEECS